MSEKSEKPSFSWQMTDCVKYCIITNTKTLATESGTEDMWLKTTSNLTEAWTNPPEDPANPPPPNSPEADYNWLVNNYHDGTFDMKWYINKHVGAGSSLDGWTSHLTTQLMVLLGQHWNDSSSPLMNVLTQQASLITSTMSKETAPADNEKTSVASLIQQGVSTSPLTDIGSAATDAANISNLNLG